MGLESHIRIVKWSPAGRGPGCRKAEQFLERPPFDGKAEQVASKILEDVRRRGDAAVVEYAVRFDGFPGGDCPVRVTDSELGLAADAVNPSFRRAAKKAAARIAAFARDGMKADWRRKTTGGGYMGERFTALDRVGIYVPGGMAPLASTVLMTAIPAKVAGVPEIVACTPAGTDGRVNPHILYAMSLAGVSEVYRIGGIQAIGMMAYGTRTVKKVRKIAGPGGVYVTAAKKLVYGNVALDLVAGPSEIAILADGGARPSHVAMDMLSQAEHGTGWEKALLVTDSPALAGAVRGELAGMIRGLRRRTVLENVAANGGLMIALVGDVLRDGVELCNRFAPEHLEIMVAKPGSVVGRIRNAGAVFVGRWTPESAGDFAAGPSHVLPTGGSAAMFSGLTADDFRKRSSIISFARGDLAETIGVIREFGSIEGLDAHVLSAEMRLQK